MMMGFGGFGLLFILFFFALIFGVAVALVSFLFPRPANPANHNQTQPHQPLPPANDSALEILKQRYARGELTREEFESMRQDILSA